LILILGFLVVAMCIENGGFVDVVKMWLDDVGSVIAWLLLGNCSFEE